MELSGTLKAAAAVVISLGTIGGGVLTLDSRHVNREDYNNYVAGNRVQRVMK